MSTCPFCQTEINPGATVCTGCGAERGYIALQDRVYGRPWALMYGVVLAGLIGVAFLGSGEAVMQLIGLGFVRNLPQIPHT